MPSLAPYAGAPAPARTRGPRDMVGLTAHRDLLAAIGDHGGLLSWKSSPHVMWLAEQLAKQMQGGGA